MIKKHFAKKFGEKTGVFPLNYCWFLQKIMITLVWENHQFFAENEQK
jgi:hypothetical protein